MVCYNDAQVCVNKIAAGGRAGFQYEVDGRIKTLIFQLNDSSLPVRKNQVQLITF